MTKTEALKTLKVDLPEDREVVGALLSDGTVVWKFKNKDCTNVIRLTGEAHLAMLSILQKFKLWVEQEKTEA